MPPLKFIKMQALRNDFVVLDAIHSNITLNTQQIKAICDRKLGVGCDQLLLIQGYKSLMSGEYIYRVFNQDGSEAGQCGNGARCVIKYLAKYHNLGTQEIKLVTLNGYILGKQIDDEQIILDMGQPEFMPAKIPFNHPLSASGIYQIGPSNDQVIGGVVSMGNPHFITRVQNLEQLNHITHLDHIVSLIHRSELFPEGINISFCYIHDRKNITIKTFERGVGWTDSCGSGACASCAHAIKQNLIDRKVLVKTMGGELIITWEEHQNLFLSGPAYEVFTGTLTNNIMT